MSLTIAITQREVANDTYPDDRDALSQDWTVYLEKVFPGAAILPIPNRVKDIHGWLGAVEPDLLILSNGNDWGTARYRDRLETEVVAFAAEEKIPTLFVCRGLQVLNALQGNRLETDIAAATGEKHVAATHEVLITGEPFRALAGADTVSVNSFHNQGVLVSDIQDGCQLVPFALTAAGVVEACVHTRHPFLAIQWHPERAGANVEMDKKLITLLVEDGAFWNNG